MLVIKLMNFLTKRDVLIYQGTSKQVFLSHSLQAQLDLLGLVSKAIHFSSIK